MKHATVHIEKMAFGGSGLGHVNGKVCFVPFSAPGDTVRITVTSEKHSYLQGEIAEVLGDSPERVPPPCQAFGACGGCNWQHLAYPAQLEEKRRIFAELMWRSGRVDASRILPVTEAPEPYGYRARVQLKVRSVAGELHVGFYRGGTHYVVDVPGTCVISTATINGLLPELTRLLRLFPEPDKIPQIDITCCDSGSAVVNFHYIGDNLEEVSGFLQANRALLCSVSGVSIQSGRKTTLRQIDGRGPLSYTLSLGNREFGMTFTPGGFSQVNYRQNRTLVATVLEWATLSGEEKILDLFCGNGNFSIPLADRCASVLGLEEYPSSIADAVRNSEINKITNAEYRCTDAVEGLKELAEAEAMFDVVILDPPRTGAADIVRLIPSLKPGKILYVSCDPPTLARDVGILRKSGYDVVKSLPVDMFPQTYHIESVTLLEPSPVGIIP